VWKSVQKRPLGRHRHILEDNIKMDLKEIGWVGIDWFDLAQKRDRWWALVFYKMWGIFWLAVKLLALQEGLCSM
jgi:hypothetical protein